MVRRLNSQRKRKVLPILIKQQNNKCFWCGIEMTPAKTKGDGQQSATAATIEHVIPLKDGGRNTMWNMRAAHYQCNIARDQKDKKKNKGIFESLDFEL